MSRERTTWLDIRLTPRRDQRLEEACRILGRGGPRDKRLGVRSQRDRRWYPPDVLERFLDSADGVELWARRDAAVRRRRAIFGE